MAFMGRIRHMDPWGRYTRLQHYNAAIWTVDLRNQSRSTVSADRQVNTDYAKHMAHAIGIRMLGDQTHQCGALRCDERGMWRYPPVYEERHDSIRDNATQVG
jgi:hypothetical protein